MSAEDPTDGKIRRAAQLATAPGQSEGMRQRYQRELMGLHFSKSMWLRPIAVDFDALPSEFDLTPPAGLSKVFFYLALFFVVMTGLPALVMIGIPDTPWWVYPIMAVGPVLSVAAVVVCWRIMRRRRWVRFDQDSVEVRQRGMPGATVWQDRYRAFRGLAMSTRTIDTRYDQRTFHTITLVHSDPDKNLPLLITSDPEPPSAQIESYARHLKLAVLRPDQERR